jgi:mono/diheme cytochrome c family protein
VTTEIRSASVAALAAFAAFAALAVDVRAIAAADSADAPTFHEVVEPLLQRHCLECHREGGAAPFSLESYGDVRGYAPQIAEVVKTRRMPPWGADPSFGHFANDRSMPAAAVETLVKWVDGGAREGDPTKAPPKRAWPNGWSIAPPPDLVLTTPSFHVPSEGTLPYEYVRLTPNLREDRWVRAAEVKSSQPQLVHHVLVFLDESRRARRASEKTNAGGAGDDATRDVSTEPDPHCDRGADGFVVPAARPWRPAFNPFELLQGAKPNERGLWIQRFQKLIQNDLKYGEAGGLNGYFFSAIAGGGAAQFADDEAKFLPAGGEFVLQIHHQPNGKAADEQTSLALWFARPPSISAAVATNGTVAPTAPTAPSVATASFRALDTRGVATVVFAIPPNAPAHEVVAEYRLPAAAWLRSLQPHMHVRGKDFTYVAKYPPKPATKGAAAEPPREETLLFVPRYDFNWQQEYVLAQPKRLPAGTVLRVVAHYDNSKDNRNNPDPSQTVYFGLQTFEEMMIGYFEVAWDDRELDEGE